MNIQPCPYCIDKSEEHKSKHKPFAIRPHHQGFETLTMIECPNCGAGGPYKIGELPATEAWNEVYDAVVCARSQQTELEAYRALSGGKTAIEYAEWIGMQRKRITALSVIIAEIRLFFREDNLINFPNRNYLIRYVKEWADALGIDADNQ